MKNSMYVPTERKVLLQVKKVYKYDTTIKHKKKPITDGEGNHLYSLEDFRVVASAIEGIKKGKKVIAIFNGGVPIPEMETKQHLYLVIDQEDIYAVSV